MEKGVAPILATVLIVLISIALAGTFLLWSSRTLSSATERGTQETQKIGSSISDSIKIEALRCVGAGSNVTIRNLGNTTIATGTDLNVLVNDVLTTVTWTPAVITQFQLAHVTGALTLNSGQIVRVITAKGASDSSRCP